MLGSTVQGAMLREAGPSVGVYSKLAPGHFSLLPQCVHLSIASKMLAFSSFVSSPFLLIFLLLTPTSPSPPPCRPSSPSQQCQYGEYEHPRCGRLCYKVFQITMGESKPASRVRVTFAEVKTVALASAARDSPAQTATGSPTLFENLAGKKKYLDL